METARKIIELLNDRQKKQALGLVALFILMSLTEVVGIASILPFMSVLSNPQIVTENKYLKAGYDFFGFQDTTSYLLLIGLGVFAALFLSNAIKAATRWITLHVTHGWGESLAKRLLETCLRQPYEFFLTRNSAELSKNILAEVHAVTSNVIIIFLDMLTKIIVTVVMLIFLAVMDPILAVATGVILGGAYTIVFIAFKKRLKDLAKQRAQAMSDKYRVVNESIQGIKNIKLCGYEKIYADHFALPARTFAVTTAKSNVMGEIPRYAMEVIAFGGILLMLLYLLLHGKQELSQAMPVIAVYVFAGYRLMPSLQGIYYGFTKIRFNKPVLDIIRKELSYASSMQDLKEKSAAPLPFNKGIKLENVAFGYGPERNIIKETSLEISAGAMVGIVGKTGAGKTTLVDLILGLLSPTSGSISIDGIKLEDGNRRNWQENLSYVSQHIYLSDDTIAANIAFGVPIENIDREKVCRAASMASISDFIENELPQGYNTVIGENGIRLSGGQRQRIGLARALYLEKPVLVLDEATSALDPETEESVMKSIHSLERNKTILIISHKVELLSKCDSIIIVQNGKAAYKGKNEALGGYEHLEAKEPLPVS
jgi:ABC-type multidrug transport system fused ATPase/permease subunit